MWNGDSGRDPRDNPQCDGSSGSSRADNDRIRND